MKVTSVLIMFSSVVVVQGFLQDFIPKNLAFSNIKHPHDIKPHTDALVGQDLEVRLEVGQKDSPQINIQQLLLHLDATDKNNKRASPSTPGAAGIITTGKSDTARSLTIQKSGSFINHAGLQEVNLDTSTAIWELIWDSPDSPAGTLVLGMDVKEDAVRNDAKLKKGHLFVGFSVWTKAGLIEYQGRKAECEVAAAAHLVERDVQLQKYMEATNIFTKMVHYRNAAAAVEKYSLYPIRSMAAIPDNGDLIPLANGSLFLTRTGTLWSQGTKNPFMAGSSFVQEGTASIKVAAMSKLLDATPVTV